MEGVLEEFNRQLEEELCRIQKSTRTTVPFLSGIHNFFRMRFTWYYRWHLWQHSSLAHLFLLLATVLAINFVSFFALQSTAYPEQARATESWLVSGAGTADVNGTYVAEGTYNGKNYYSNGSFELCWEPNIWYLVDFCGGAYVAYRGDFGQENLPAEPWVALLGDAPAPSVSSGGDVITVSGTVYTAENESTNIGSGKTVALSINGAAATAVETGVGGTFSFNTVTVSADQTVGLYLDGEAESASLVTQAVDSSTNITGLKLFTSHIVLRQETSNSMTNTLLATADDVADSDLMISVNVSNKATFSSDNILWIISGEIYVPGGDVSAGTIKIGGVFTPESYTVTLNDNSTPFVVDGTFNSGTSTVIYAGAGSTTVTSTTYYNLRTQPSSEAVSGYVVSGAGTTEYNGNYTQAGTHNGQDYYIHVTDYLYLYYDYFIEPEPGYAWVLNSSLTDVNDPYMLAPYESTGGITDTWETGMMGGAVDPAPTVAIAAGANAYTFSAGTLLVNGSYANGDGTNAIEISANTNDPTIDIHGSFTNSADATFNASSSAVFSTAGNFTNNGIYNDSLGTLTLDGSSLQTITAGGTGSGNNFYNLTLTNSSTAGTSFADSVMVSGTFTNITPSSKVIFHAGSTYTFSAININGGSTATRISLRSSSSGVVWILNVSASSPTVSSVDVQDANASGGSQIQANDGSNLDSGNNTNWLFPTLVTLDHLVLNSTNVALTKQSSFQFGVTAYDSNGSEVSGLSYTWLADSAAGTITQDGFFTAGTTAGDFTNGVSVFAGGKAAGSTIIVREDPPNIIPGWIIILPASTKIQAGEQFQFTATVFDTSGNVYRANPTWEFTGEEGSITKSGLFTAGQTEATYTNAVVAKYANLRSYATITVFKEVVATNKDDNIETTAKTEQQPTSAILNNFKSVADNVSQNLPVKIAVLALAATSAAVSAGISFVGVVATQMNLKDILLIIVNYIMAFFAARRKDKMGQVFDELTKKPVDKAVVELFRYPEMKLVATALSDKFGHFIFIVKEGNYVLSVIRPGFVYPSIMAKTDSKFSEMYIGQVINVRERSGAINVSVPIDPVTREMKLKRQPFLSLMRSKTVRYSFTIIGTVISLYALVTDPIAANFVVSGLFVLIWAMEFNIINRNLKFSKITDAISKKPVSLALVRVKNADGRYAETFVSDEEGLVLPRSSGSNQEIQIDKDGYNSVVRPVSAVGFVEKQKFILQPNASSTNDQGKGVLNQNTEPVLDQPNIPPKPPPAYRSSSDLFTPPASEHEPGFDKRN